MDRDLARLVVWAAYRAASEIGDLVSLVDEHGPDEDLKLGIATASYEIYANIIKPVFRAVPDLEAEFDTRISKYGRAS
jgi:hypothetical protein